jgi:hypothetical protein
VTPPRSTTPAPNAWKVVRYKRFEIALEPWGDGNYNAHLTDTMNDYDWGMVASYMPRAAAIKEARYVADEIERSPYSYEADE